MPTTYSLARIDPSHKFVHPCDGLGSGRQDIAIVEKIVPRLQIEIIPRR